MNITTSSAISLQQALDTLAGNWNIENAESVDGVSANCPHCGVFASFLQIQKNTLLASLLLKARAERYFIQAKCSACQRLALVASQYVDAGEGATRLALTLLWPRTIRASRAPRDLPSEIARDNDEARTILADSPTAAAVLARRCVQHVIREKLNIHKSRLIDEIAEAIKRDELTKPTRNALDHVRTIGNWGAHPTKDPADTLMDVGLEEASYTLDVLELLFYDLYTVPSQISAMTSRLRRTP